MCTPEWRHAAWRLKRWMYGAGPFENGMIAAIIVLAAEALALTKQARKEGVAGQPLQQRFLFRSI